MNFFRSIPWAIAITLAVFLCIEKCKKQPPLTIGAGPRINDTVKIVETYKDPLGNEHIIVKDGENVISKSELKNPNRQKTIVDTSAANLKIAVAEIQRVTKIATALTAEKLKAERKVDELTKKLSFAYSDEYVKLRYTPPDVADTVSQGTFDFGYNAELTITQYQKRKWFLGAKESYIDISSNDPRTTIRGVRQLTVKQEMPSFGARVQANANYNINYKSYGFGPALRIDLGRFSFQGNYTYYPNSRNWGKSINANYDLIRF